MIYCKHTEEEENRYLLYVLCLMILFSKILNVVIISRNLSIRIILAEIHHLKFLSNCGHLVSLNLFLSFLMSVSNPDEMIRLVKM